MDYIERMEEEKDELEVKSAKLDIFMTNNEKNLSKLELMLMYHQRKIMEDYIRTLNDRIYLAKNNI